LEISLPPLAEQTRLATILATMDLLIEKEQSLLVALKAQKRGLMQKLLTGQWRVPTNEGDSIHE
jgi:type I restriction enzyme S subunit